MIIWLRFYNLLLQKRKDGKNQQKQNEKHTYYMLIHLPYTYIIKYEVIFSIKIPYTNF